MATTTEVPGRYHVGINGRGYMLAPGSTIKHASIPLLRAQADVSTQPGASSINPAVLWRRSITSWHHGAGQVYFDEPDSNPFRFYTSLNADVWTPGQFGPLKGTANRRSTAGTNLFLVVAGSRLYSSTGATLSYTTDITVGSPTWTNVTGTSATTVGSLASDGYFVYVANGADGIYLTNSGTGAAAQWITGTVNLVRYVKGRLLAFAANTVYNVTTSTGIAGPTALPAALFTHTNAQFTWVDACEGAGQIYMAGYAGDKSLVYRTAVQPDGTALSVPVVAGELPDGEIVNACYGYLGFVLVGSNKGVRLATSDESGNLTFGPLIQSSSVTAFEGQDRFVWFNGLLANHSNSGLARLDLSVFPSGTLAPAFASDLQPSTSGIVRSIVTFQNQRVFGVDGTGVFTETSTYATPVSLATGIITFGVEDTKRLYSVEARFAAGANAGDFNIIVGSRQSGSTTLATLTISGTNKYSVSTSAQTGEEFQITAGIASPTALSLVERITVRADPLPMADEFIEYTIDLSEKVTDLSGNPLTINPKTEYDELVALRSAGTVVPCEEAGQSYNGSVVEYEWDGTRPVAPQRSASWFHGRMRVVVKKVAS